jgi:DNA invertase Pin-like site-specific DNA recombinase
MERYGYVRVSAKDQNPERQVLAMKEANIQPQNIFLDKMSGQDFSRPQYRQLLKRLKKGDVMIVKSIDRLGRKRKEHLLNSVRRRALQQQSKMEFVSDVRKWNCQRILNCIINSGGVEKYLCEKQRKNCK